MINHLLYVLIWLSMLDVLVYIVDESFEKNMFILFDYTFVV